MRLLLASPARYVPEDRSPSLVVHVKEYPVDPTGATVAFQLVHLADDTLSATAGVPTITGIQAIERSGLTTWDFDLTMPWAAGDLPADGAGLYFARFGLTLSGKLGHLPPDKSLLVEILSPVLP